MTKYITVKLTEDQIREVIRGLEDRMENLSTSDYSEEKALAYAERLRAKLLKAYRQS